MSLDATIVRQVGKLALLHTLPNDVLLGIVEQESSGTFLWKVGSEMLPAINIEPAYFYRILKAQDKAKLALAIKAGLAAPSRTGCKIPNTYAARYAMLNRMIAIDSEAAYRSMSIGAGQVMGDNYASLGYSTAQQLYDDAKTGADAQIRQMVNFIMQKPGLAQAVRKHDYKTIAYLYNGPGYRANHYDTDLEGLVEHQSQPTPYTVDCTDADRITALGYADVKAFQTAQGLNPDGVIGRATKDAIVAEEQRRKHVQVTKPATKGAVVVGTGAVVVGSAGDVVVEAAQKSTSWLDELSPVLDAVEQFSTYGPRIILVLVAALVVAAAAYVVISHFKGKAA